MKIKTVNLLNLIIILIIIGITYYFTNQYVSPEYKLYNDLIIGGLVVYRIYKSIKLVI